MRSALSRSSLAAVAAGSAAGRRARRVAVDFAVAGLGAAGAALFFAVRFAGMALLTESGDSAATQYPRVPRP